MGRPHRPENAEVLSGSIRHQTCRGRRPHLPKLPVGSPRGVTAISVIFFLASAYLLLLGLIMLISPGSVSMTLGSPLLHGLELSGPYMFLLAAAVGTVVGYGLFRLKNLARRAAIMIALAGMVMLIPKVSADTSDISPRFFLAGSALIIRMMIVWYLWQRWTVERFH